MYTTNQGWIYPRTEGIKATLLLFLITLGVGACQDSHPKDLVTSNQDHVQGAISGASDTAITEIKSDPNAVIVPAQAELKIEAVSIEPSPVIVTEVASSEGIPKITPNQKLYDFGEVGVASKNIALFTITNEGTGTLSVTDISKCCGAIITLNDHDFSQGGAIDIAPGQQASISAEYRAPTSPGTMKKDFSILSNDPVNPALKLSIMAKVIEKMEWSPRQIKLSARKENAGFPAITLKALDGQPFAIQRFWATGDAVTLKVDPNYQATEMTVQPQAVMKKLMDMPSGRIRFYLSRQDYAGVECFYDVLKPYATNPASFFLFKADPKKTEQKKLWVLDNYAREEDKPVSMEIESIKTLDHDLAKVISQKPLDDGIELILALTPPDPVEVRSHMFSDTLEIRIKGEPDPIHVMVKGFYTATVAAEAKKRYTAQKKAALREKDGDKTPNGPHPTETEN